MSGLFGQSEKVNNVLFVGILVLVILILHFFIMGSFENFRFWLTLFLSLLLFSSIIFGYVSKNPKKSFLLCFLIWASFPLYILYIIVDSIVSNQTSIITGITEAAIPLLVFFITGIISGSTGYFVAADHPDKNRRIIYRVLSFVLFLIVFLITVVLYFVLQ